MTFWKNPKLVSACLLGMDCKYDGGNRLSKKVLKFCQREGCLPICPEILGGLPTPRPPCQILGGDGKDVLRGKAKVIGRDGKNYTQFFIKGAKEVLKIAKILNAKEAILKENSPSCGKRRTGIFRRGEGVLTALLRKNKIKISSENEL